MRILFGVSLCASMLGLILFAGRLISPPLMDRLGLDLGEIIQAERQLRECLRQREILNVEGARVLASIATRRRIVHDLDVGNVTLLDAAAGFRELSRKQSREHLRLSRSYFGGATEAECLCRQVIHFLECEVNDRPDGPARIDDFRDQLETMLHAGTIDLAQ